MRKIFSHLLFFLISFCLLFSLPGTVLAVNGDANNDGKVDGIDYVIWLNNYNKTVQGGSALGDFDANSFVDGIDYVIWLNNYNTIGSTGPTTTPSITAAPTSPAGELNISVCDPANGPFSANITNEYFALPQNMKNIIEGNGFKVEITVLSQTEVVAGINTKVFQEREWSNGNLVEISRNFAVQAPDGTVCYYGEDVDIYTNGVITAHDGSWRAGIGQNKPGILMPAHPSAGQTYYQEMAPGVAQDRAFHTSVGGTFSTPAGIFNNVLSVEETPPSAKKYAKGIGMIYDDGAVLTSH